MQCLRQDFRDHHNLQEKERPKMSVENRGTNGIELRGSSVKNPHAVLPSLLPPQRLDSSHILIREL